MDGVIIFGIAIYLAMEIKKGKPDTPKLEKRLNPDFIKNENAFLKLYNKIMKR